MAGPPFLWRGKMDGPLAPSAPKGVCRRRYGSGRKEGFLHPSRHRTWSPVLPFATSLHCHVNFLPNVTHGLSKSVIAVCGGNPANGMKNQTTEEIIPRELQVDNYKNHMETSTPHTWNSALPPGVLVPLVALHHISDVNLMSQYCHLA